MIKDFKPRLYQETILATAVNANTLVVLPTGMGKTAISMLLAAQRLRQYPLSKILILAPTRPLVEQHLETFKKHFDVPENQMVVFTGFVSPDKRQELWKDAKVIFSTPQGLENDVINKKIALEEVSLLVFDEAHRASGDYSYVFIAKQYDKLAKFPRILALTASPGSDVEKIKEIMTNLCIESVEVRTDKDPDVAPYVKKIDIKWAEVELPPVFKQIQKFLKDFIGQKMQKLKEWGILRRENLQYVSKKDLLLLQGQLRGRAASGEKDFVLWNGISVLAEIIKIHHALELLESQGVIALHKYLTKLQNESFTTKTKAVKNIVRDLNFRAVFIKTQRLYEEGFQHPKLIELQRMIEQEVGSNKDIKIIVFNQFRDNALNIMEELNKLNGVSARLFVGQLKKGDTGMSQKEQKEGLSNFRESKFNVLVATSIGEEGLDIPKVDLVIFYEPIPSAIRHIQRRGRTGRQEKGRVVVLVTKDTRDEGYRWSAFHKEKRMYKNLANLKNKLISSFERPKQAKEKQDEFVIKIFADHREKGSGAVKELIDNNVDVRLEHLDSADYVLSERLGVEIKTVADFADSIIDGRLLEQLKYLKQDFEKSIVIVEGEQDLFSARNIHPNAIRGMLATIAVSYGIPILFTKNPKDTAALLKIIAKREQEEAGNDFSLHSNRKPTTLKEQQEYLVSCLPNIGSSLAKELLKQFGSPKGVFDADEEKLKEVSKIGEKKAKGIRNVIESKYPHLPSEYR